MSISTISPLRDSSQPSFSASSRPRYLSVREIAGELGKSSRFVIRLILAGDLPAVRLGIGRSSWSVKREDLEAFLRGREKAAREELNPVVKWRRGRR